MSASAGRAQKVSLRSPRIAQLPRARRKLHLPRQSGVMPLEETSWEEIVAADHGLSSDNLVFSSEDGEMGLHDEGGVDRSGVVHLY